jgi:hypothetical protein
MPKKDTRIKKGQVLNPHGRPKIPEDLKKARKLTKTRAAQLFELFMNKSVEELEKVCKDKKTTVLEGMIARVAMKAIQEGDPKRLDFMLDRTIGKVKEVKEIQLPKPMIVENLEDGNKTLLGAKEETIEADIVEEDPILGKMKF